jgi:hypothetical protein
MRTPSSRSRFRRPAAILVLLVLAAAAWIAATGLAGARTGAHRAAKLVLRSHDPASVSGTGFKARSRVRVTYAGAQTFVRRPVTNSLGAFTTTFPTVVDRCSGFTVSASQPGRATIVLRSPARPECAPASTP